MKTGISAKITTVFSVLVIAATIAVSEAITSAGSELLMDAAVKRLGHQSCSARHHLIYPVIQKQLQQVI